MMGFKPCSLPSVADSVEISPLGVRAEGDHKARRQFADGILRRKRIIVEMLESHHKMVKIRRQLAVFFGDEEAAVTRRFVDAGIIPDGMGRLRVRNRRASEGGVKFLDTVKHRLVVIQHPLIPVAIGRAHHGVHRLLHKRVRDQRHIHVHADEHAQIQIGYKGRGAGKAVDIAAVLRHAVAAIVVKAPAQTEEVMLRCGL